MDDICHKPDHNCLYFINKKFIGLKPVYESELITSPKLPDFQISYEDVFQNLISLN